MTLSSLSAHSELFIKYQPNNTQKHMKNTVRTVKASRINRDRTRSKRQLGLDYEHTYPTPWERQLREDIDRGYKYFYEQRGTQPPRVSKDILFF